MKLHYAFILLFSTISFSQTTHDISWSLGASNADLTINEGDAVRWTWGDTFNHTVTSTSGDHSFDSGTINGLGATYEFTFNTAGVTDYVCNFHAGSMFGTITVNSTASIEDQNVVVFNYSPNPVRNKLRISAELPITEIAIYSVLGQEVFRNTMNESEVDLDISSFQNNLYITKLTFEGNRQAVFRLIKN